MLVVIVVVSSLFVIGALWCFFLLCLSAARPQPTVTLEGVDGGVDLGEYTGESNGLLVSSPDAIFAVVCAKSFVFLALFVRGICMHVCVK